MDAKESVSWDGYRTQSNPPQESEQMRLPFLHAIPDAELPSQVEWFFATSRKVQLQQLWHEATPTSEDQAEAFRLLSLALAKSLHSHRLQPVGRTPSIRHSKNIRLDQRCTLRDILAWK